MNNPAQITWLLPVLNGMPFLPETLASIESQSFRDFEVLFWDNGSTDGTLELMREWVPARLPGRIVSGRPLGLGACLGEMVKMATTELCARIDSDDVNYPERLERQVNFLQDNPDVVAVGTQVRSINEEGKSLSQQQTLPVRHEEIVLRLIRRWALWHPTVTFRKEAVLRAGNYLDERPVEDYSLWLRLARVGRLANLSEILLDRRVHQQSIVQLSKKEGELAGYTTNCIAKYGVGLYGLEPGALARIAEGGSLNLREQRTLYSQLLGAGARAVPLGVTILQQHTLPTIAASLRRRARAIRKATRF